MDPYEAQRMMSEAIADYDRWAREQDARPGPALPVSPEKQQEEKMQQHPRTMSPTEQQLWDQWFTKSFELHWQKWITGFVKMLAKEVALTQKQVRSEIVHNLRAEIAQVRGVAIRGTYDPNANYHQHDIVARNGGSFIAIKDDPGTCPGEGWQLLAGQGKRGRDADSAGIVQEIVALRRQVAELRTQVKALQAAQDGDVVDLPKWPLSGASQ
jgi:hypothetical protein